MFQSSGGRGNIDRAPLVVLSPPWSSFGAAGRGSKANNSIAPTMRHSKDLVELG